MRWRDRGDAAALARVFDLCAPGLLRLAVHLVGDVAAAEDLVQATFVTAMERAPTFDGIRALDPWLAGILSNHARGLKRDARRVGTASDIEARLELDLHTPLDSALAAEESAALAKAVDALPEPYRAVLLLRLRHGLKDADIAHVLDRSPGAVRVQLHRGRELLKRIIPAGLVASVLAIGSGRGLAAVKNAVVDRALATKAAGTVGAIGGIMTAKKLLAGACVGVCVAVLFVAWRHARLDGLAAIAPSVPAAQPNLARAQPDVLAPLTTPPERAPSSTEPSIATPPTDTVPMPGLVIDGRTGAPIAGARVELFPVRSRRLSKLIERWSDRFCDVDGNGTPRSITWPLLPGDVGELAAFDKEDLHVYAAPDEGEKPIDSTTSDSEGRFALRAPTQLGFVVCTAGGHATRRIACLPSVEQWVTEGAHSVRKTIPFTSLTIPLFQPRPLSGRLVDENGRPVALRMRIAFEGWCILPGKADEPENSRAIDTWAVETDEHGEFHCELPAQKVDPRSLEPGILLSSKAALSSDDGPLVSLPVFMPGEETKPVDIVVRRVGWLSVQERATHAPIERFSMIIRSLAGGSTFWSGRFFARAGRLQVVPMSVWQSAGLTSEMGQPHEVTIWDEHHAPTTVKVASLLQPGETIVALDPGEPPTLSGIVHAGAHASASTKVVLARATGMTWSLDAWERVDVALTDAEGRFTLHAPAGHYALIVDRGGPHASGRSVELPCAQALDVDLQTQSTLVLHVRDDHGTPCTRRDVELVRADGRMESAETDDQGAATWSSLEPGAYDVRLRFMSGIGRYAKPAETHVDLGAAETRQVQMEVTTPKQIHPRLVVDGAADLHGWRATIGLAGDDPLVDVEPDGRIPINIAALPQIDVTGPEGGWWTVRLPEAPPDGFVIHIALVGPGWSGLVVHANGSPAIGVGVTAFPDDASRTRCPTIEGETDTNGHFELRGLTAHSYKLGLETEATSATGTTLCFVPATKPAEPPAKILITLPDKRATHVVTSGRVQSTSAKAGEILIAFRAEYPSESGVLQVLHATYVHVAEDGTYTVRLPAAPTYVAEFHHNDKMLGAPQSWSAPTTSNSAIHDFELP